MAYFNSTIQIGEDLIGPGQPVYLVAEMSANHGQDYNKAVEIMHAAKEAGANAIKLQTYSADTLTLDCKRDEFYITKGAWKGQYMYDLYKSAMMPWEWHADLKAEAEKLGITIFSAAFDGSAVQLLDEMNFPAIKIASPELIDLDLIRAAAETGRPLIISTGMGTLAEIQEAVNVVRESGNRNLCLLKCTAEYPAPFENMHLRTIPHLRETFACPTGLSDHSLGVSVPIASIALGACMVEKHFVLSREDKTADSFFSATPEQFAQLVKSVREVEKALGEVNYPMTSEPARRSLYAVKDIAEGEAFSKQNVRNLRPGVGLPPKHLNTIVGRTSRRSITRGEPLQWDMIY